MLKIIPAILTDEFDELRDKISQAEGKVDRIQIDIIDGEYANNKTIDPSVVANIDTNLNIDFHLMVSEPINWVEKCVNAFADRVIAQIEMMENQQDFINKVVSAGVSPGLAIDLETDIDEVDPAVLANIDVILVMSVEAGFGGQKFDKRALEKIEKLDNIRQELHAHYRICDDGGITLESIDDLRVAGVDEVSIGARLFKGSLSDNLDEFLKAAYKHEGKRQNS